ncbi:YicC/YloC family endoribonuclease [Algoriphagus persicinus]|uniref:YicC/YloC family endoribonuclease n=1 Tax=Algoriphagus persicinus TaxID=3108754 RepID=UPI002B3C0C21|nr:MULTISPECIES: YicC/YloC family endoribonuclease [unclassified Algoriphagus]MEB2782116.1 YicC/YloC family endoribonuclease [Algoriphagus sp. C2-6-M1]MEB2784377.1 YicC/YloC family endoribonuclease [Algoriphagus sp. E1-3-M2]
MIKSMTGFGNAGFEDERMVIQVEVRTLNSKFLDLSIRSPRQFNDKELEIRNLVQSILDRGKVSISIDFQSKGSVEMPVAINEDLFNLFYQKYKDLAESVNDSSQDIFKLALQSPSVITQLTGEERDDQADWDEIKKVLTIALNKCDSFRQDEGNSLEEKLQGNIKSIATGLKKIEGEEGNRKDRINQKIRNHFNEWLDENSFDANRFEQELIYYFEKLDITEEIVRLGTHLKYFEKCLDEESSQGKKLGFISQEIGREINTIGSKANDAGMQKHVILMKDELEKVKEQSLNVL